MFVYTRKTSPSVGRCQGEKLAWAIERFEWRIGIIPIRRVQRILWLVLVGGIEWVSGTVAIRWIDRVSRIIAVRRVKRIVWRVGLCGVQGLSGVGEEAGRAIYQDCGRVTADAKRSGAVSAAGSRRGTTRICSGQQSG
jgi:hypothetical protein